MHVHAYIHVCVAYEHTCMHRPEEHIRFPPPSPFEVGLSLNLELMLAHLGWKPASPSLLLVPGTEVTGMCRMPGLLHGC